MHFINITEDNNVVERTIEDFVEDCISDGRTIKQMMTIAGQTRWKSKIAEIKEYAKNFNKIVRKG